MRRESVFHRRCICVCVLLVHGCMCSTKYSIILAETWLLNNLPFLLQRKQRKEHQNSNSTNDNKEQVFKLTSLLSQLNLKIWK